MFVRVSFLIYSISSLCFAAASDYNPPDLEIIQGEILNEAEPLNDLIERHGEESSWDELEQNEKIESRFISELLNRFPDSEKSERVKIIWATHESVRNARIVQRAKLIMQWRANIYMYIEGVRILSQRDSDRWYHVTEDFQGRELTTQEPIPDSVAGIIKEIHREKVPTSNGKFYLEF